MRHPGRRLTVVMKVSALVTALMWLTKPRGLAGMIAAILLLAVSLLGLRRRRPRLPRSSAGLVASVTFAVGLALIVTRAGPYVPAVMAVWTGLAAVAALVWLCANPGARQSLFAWLRVRQTETPRGQIMTSER